MMKVGISTWSLLRSDVYSAVRSIGDAGFEYIEIWGEVPHAYPDWVDKKRLKDTLSTYSMTLTLHAPFTDLNPAAPYEPVKGAITSTLCDFVNFGVDLGAIMITSHPGGVHSQVLVPQMAQNSAAVVQAMVREADGRLTVSVENQAASRSKYSFPLCNSIESIDLVLAEIEGGRFTLDSGHAHTTGVTPLSLAERVGGRLAEIHLSDNNGTSDDHLIPGEGTAALQGLLDRVAGTDVLICLEIDPHRYSEEQVLQAALAVKDRLGQGRKRR